MNRTGGKIPGLCALVTLALLGACASEAPLRGPEVRIGVTPDLEPIVFEQEGRIAGVEADLARELAKDLGWRIRWVRVAREDQIDALVKGRVDVLMTGLVVTEDRRRAVDFTDPYLEIGQMALVREEDRPRLAPATQMFITPARVGFERGTTGEQALGGRLARSRVLAYDSVEDGLAALREGKIDYFVHDAPTVWRHAHDPGLAGLFRPLTRDSLAWAVRRTDPKLRQEMNAVLARMAEDGRLQAILERWVGPRVAAR
jgi:ABC-type amino acid transport substrate-binding protein